MRRNRFFGVGAATMVLAACASEPTELGPRDEATGEAVATLNGREITEINSQQGDRFYGENDIVIDNRVYRLKGFSLDGGTLDARDDLTVRVVRGGLQGRAGYASNDGAAKSVRIEGNSPLLRTRDSGWQRVGSEVCEPGEMVRLTWKGNGGDQVVMRACPGREACDHAESLPVNNGRSCTEARCLVLETACPNDGSFTLLAAGPGRVGGAFTLWRGTDILSTQFPERAPVQGRQLEGAKLKAIVTRGRESRLLDARIRAVRAPARNFATQAVDESISTWLYDVEIDVPTPDGGVKAQDLCLPTAHTEDEAFLRRAAVVVDATWNENGSFTRTTNDAAGGHRAFAFACLSGAVGKCYKWGYRPWGDDELERSENFDHMQTCVRMARADYCGDGVANTCKGARISFWDESTPDLKDGHPDEASWSFEAGWNADGATCLSTRRWQTLGIDSTRYYPQTNKICGFERLWDFRPRPGEASPWKPRVCNTAAEARAQRARLMNRWEDRVFPPNLPPEAAPSAGWDCRGPGTHR